MKLFDRMTELEKKIGYHFTDRSLLETALRHSSYTNEKQMPRTDCNERMEFLGDAVLELVSSEYLFCTFPDMPEGELTKLRAKLVCEPTLAHDARQIDLGSYLLLGKGEDLTGGRQRDSVTSDALEALIGAIYLDGGQAAARGFIMRLVLDDINHKQLFFDSKTSLQEMVQKDAPEMEISYRLVSETGPDHAKQFTTEVWIGQKKAGTGTGTSKKASEQQAAYHAICDLQGEHAE
ncbi:MAG: ribonuclease III [Eubacterium sp.]|nr:ribonuclease III [Eubacterium sp.]